MGKKNKSEDKEAEQVRGEDVCMEGIGELCEGEAVCGEEAESMSERGAAISCASDEPSLARCMMRLLHSPALGGDEAKKLLQNGFCEEEINQTLLLAQAVLTKAVEKGDVSAYREVKALIDAENEGNGQFEWLLGGIREAVLFEQGKAKERGPD